MPLMGDWWHKLFMKIPGTIDLQWENVCHHYNSFSFDRMFLKLTDKLGMDEISDKFETWPDRIINLRVTSP